MNIGMNSESLPSLLLMNDGRSCTRELWPERRMELLDILQRHLYGITPAPPANVSGEVETESKRSFFGGKASHRRIRLEFDTPGGPCSFPFELFLPATDRPVPLLIYLSFRPNYPDVFCPVEEITDHGIAVAYVCYKDIVNDNHHGDYSDGLGKLFIGQRERELHEWGKIGMWAYAASRMLDYLQTYAEIDRRFVVVGGHSRLGKTALWCAAQDERFKAAISNNSGIFGAALYRKSTGERIFHFEKAGSWEWFCEQLRTYDGKDEGELPFDQHMVMAAIAPRYILVGSAAEDQGADPVSEFASCHAASEVYHLLGVEGLVAPEHFPDPETVYHEGHIGYHLRNGYHSLIRSDWHRYIAFINEKYHEMDQPG